METNKEIVIVSGDEGDWAGLYINGVLVYEDHSLDASYTLKKLKIKFKEREATIDPMVGYLPKKLEDVK
jgi:hypothetical protein